MEVYLRDSLVRVQVTTQGEAVELLSDLHSVSLGLLPGVQDDVGANVVVRQGALKGPPLPVTASVGPDFQVPALFNHPNERECLVVESTESMDDGYWIESGIILRHSNKIFGSDRSPRSQDVCVSV